MRVLSPGFIERVLGGGRKRRGLGRRPTSLHLGRRGIPVRAQLRPMAILTTRFAGALGPRRIARPVALRRAKRNNVFVSDIAPARSPLLAGDAVPITVEVAVVPHCEVV